MRNGCAPYNRDKSEERLMRVRQIAVVANDRDKVVDEFCHVLGIEVAFEDPGISAFGLHNAVMPVGETFLEVVSPIREGTTAGRHLERHGGDTGYMVIVQTPSLDRDRKRMEELGVRIVWEGAEEHTSTIHLHPRDVGGAILSLDQSVPWETWDWAGPNWRDAVRTDSVSAIVGVEVGANDPDAMASRWGEIVETAPQNDGEGRPTLSLEASGMRFSPAELEGVCGIEMVSSDPTAVRQRAQARGLAVDERGGFSISGTRIRLVEDWSTS